MTSFLLASIHSCIHLLFLLFPLALSHPSPIPQAGDTFAIPSETRINTTISQDNGLIICNHDPGLPQVFSVDCLPLITHLVAHIPDVNKKEYHQCAGFYRRYNDKLKCWIELKSDFKTGGDEFSLGDWLQQGLEVIEYAHHDLSYENKRRLTLWRYSHCSQPGQGAKGGIDQLGPYHYFQTRIQGGALPPGLQSVDINSPDFLGQLEKGGNIVVS